MKKIFQFVISLVVLFLNTLAFAIDAPTLSLSISGLDVTASWSSVEGANGYTLYYAPNPYLGEQTIESADIGPNTSFSVTLWDGASYYVAITSSDAGGESGYSNIGLFDIGNAKPTAEAISLSVDSTIPYIQQQLSGSDSDGDTIMYELVSASSGLGYSQAYVNESSGMLYLTHEADGNDSFSVSYRVTDGLLYSDTAAITVSVSYLSEEEKNTGIIDVAPEDYSQFALSTYNSGLLGAVGDSPSEPNAIDLSPNFPSPGDQGNQSSCVGWATAYAAKSYQEKVEAGWSLNTSSHLFSPAYLYNQINGGQDQGSYIHEALQLVVDKGAATLATMPYSDNDYRSQPSSSANAEAANYKGEKWYRVNDSSQIKAALANRKPVIVGIAVYEQLMNLSGTNSVYNTASGSNQGGHAVTIVGYDNNRFGGAFKIINSWSQNFGDNGYFWMPYSFVSQVMSEAYVLIDAENGTEPAPEDPTEPVPDFSTLPNLTIESWDATYEEHSRGAGSLTYSVINSGAGIATAGADINLMLSPNAEITGTDYYVVYETIPFDLESGESVYRDSSNTISFQFPDQLESGTYYMALWVDDQDAVVESNENDNISKNTNDLVTIQNSLSDLQINSWYADWDAYGYGALTYEIVNNGSSPTTSSDWYINLVLDPDQIVGNGNETFLFYEQAGLLLNPGEYIFRDQITSPAAYFNLYEDYYGNMVSPGTYFLALWVDDLDYESESNELNNGSYSWGTVSISAFGAQAYNDSDSSNMKGPVEEKNKSLSGKAYNGKKLPPKNLVMRQVEITRTVSGKTNIKLLTKEQDKKIGENGSKKTKRISATASAIFPLINRMAMPNED